MNYHDCRSLHDDYGDYDELMAIDHHIIIKVKIFVKTSFSDLPPGQRSFRMKHTEMENKDKLKQLIYFFDNLLE